jgi:hypothetical protein
LGIFGKIKDMDSIEKIRNSLIDKIGQIEDKELLKAIDKLVEVSIPKAYDLSPEQVKALEASEEDIKYGRLKSDEDVNNDEDQWLKE